MKKQASLKDLRRMCDHYCVEEQLCHDGIITTRAHRNCRACPLKGYDCDPTTTKDMDKINDIVVKWCEEHPAQTRADVFLKQYPKARRFLLYADSDRLIPAACPKDVDCGVDVCCQCEETDNCYNCRKKYWLTEVDE